MDVLTLTDATDSLFAGRRKANPGAGAMQDKIVHETEWEDVENVLKQHERRKDEFDISENVVPVMGNQIQTLQGTITFINRKTSADRKYQTGHGSAWVSELDQDLKAGVL